MKSRLNAKYLPSYRFDMKSCISFRLVPMLVTLNGEMALILHYFTDFVYDVVVKQLLGLPWFQNLLLIVYDHINRPTICTLFNYYLGKTNFDIVTQFDGRLASTCTMSS